MGQAGGVPVHDVADGVDIPRVQAGPNPQHLLATILGEYLESSDADLPSAAVVAVLREFGISESSARAALSRLVRRGLIAARRPGPRGVYHLTPQAIARHRSRMHHFLTFGAHPPRWSGDWTVVTFSLPEPRPVPRSGQVPRSGYVPTGAQAPRTGHAQRHDVRRVLGHLGFVRLYDSVWIRPGRELAVVSEALRDTLGGTDRARWSVMCAQFDDEAGPHGPTAAYDLSGLAAGYEAFVDRYAPLRATISHGDVSAAEALVARTSIMDSWRVFADTDPDLPEHLLPAPWPRRAARELFLEIHLALGPLAEARLIEITRPYWPQAASWITHFQATDQPASVVARGER
jgi:phenylacetic acid degradation operon negative regulatory protein